LKSGYFLTLNVKDEDSSLLEELLYLANATAIILSNDFEETIFELDPGKHPSWKNIKMMAIFDKNINTERKILELKNLFELSCLPIKAPKFLNEIKDLDWVTETRKKFTSLNLGKVKIMPIWSKEFYPISENNLYLNFGLAFGTGQHPTTKLCLDWLIKNDIKGSKVLDYGCGSGILALVAAKLGASKITAVDHDLQAVQATKENATQNKLDIDCFVSTQFCDSSYDIVIANILLIPLKDLSSKLTSKTKRSGKLVLSGILEYQVDEIKTIYNQLKWNAPVIKHNWALLEGSFN